MTCPPVALVPDIHLDYDEFFIFLAKIMVGVCPLPGNVITDVNPYNYEPSNLPDGIWYLVSSKGNGAIELGFWRVKGEACKLFSNSTITGWRKTLEFFRGQVPHEKKTEWIMQEYWITREEPSENSKMKEFTSLCRVFHDSEPSLDHHKRLRLASPHIPFDSTQSIVPNDLDVTNIGSTSKHEAENGDKTEILGVTGESPSYLVETENTAETDCLSGGDFLELLDLDIPASPSSSSDNSSCLSRGDFLELLDLDIPASPSSSSDNSSCFTMSSDECFDSQALLQEIESDMNKDLAQKDENSSLKPDEVVQIPACPGSYASNEEGKQLAEEIIGANEHKNKNANYRDEGPSSSGVGTSSKDEDDKVLQNSAKNKNANYRDEGPSSSGVGTSFNHGILFRDEERQAENNRMKKLKKKKKKNKYLCFMPFHFF